MDNVNFIGYKTIDLLLKRSQVEVLLNFIEWNKGCTVRPFKCPAIGRKNDYGKDMEGEPVCILKDKRCPYFVLASFSLEDYEKKIMCNAINVEEIKGKD